MTTTNKKWAFLPKAGSILLLMAIILGAMSWLKTEHSFQAHRADSEIIVYELEPPETILVYQDARPPGDRREGHHGPPPPLGFPPTVLFMIGGALGYLIGSQRKGPRFPPSCHHDKPPAALPDD